ncbi:phosphoribosyltransferase [Thermobaculum terrenum ATCC BAA-798]|uniref:Phosphoribosyltransferase n=1 Tax=Thermobaculum terrenum (strain ATCC BAA-798 / CCMEE 7001 / YNP1) TaxID=525904 RepID=D1CFR5_THET1|nr:phosphoribosyltransferase [Thermobaculum terrenum]ACZ41771.1 phosphoribosyltransferase [Thermobaculum terrenum ATCC BAA-798]
MFRNRSEAGRKLAEKLSLYKGQGDVVVLALPRGGVPVGYEIATYLGVPMDVLVARKLGAPGQPELGIGAIAPGGIRVLDDRLIRLLGVSKEYIEKVSQEEAQELQRRTQEYRDGRPDIPLEGKTVIIVDDGLATGVTARAAVESVRRRNPKKIILAIPVCASQAIPFMRSLVDELVCLLTPSELGAVGLWYSDFRQISDEEVKRLIESTQEQAQSKGEM